MSHRLAIAAAMATILVSIALYPVVSGWLWFWESAGAITVVALAGALTRIRALPVVICAAVGLAALLLYLNVLFASAQSAAGLAPTLSSLVHLGQLARRGLEGTNRFAPPAPAWPAILLLTTAGTGLIAVATDLLAVRLRRPAAAGLPLLVLFCVPLTVSLHQGVFGAMTVFCLGMAGYLMLLVVDGRDRLRLWGRLVTADPRTQGLAVTERPAAAEGLVTARETQTAQGLATRGPATRAVRGPATRAVRGPVTRELTASGRRIGLTAVALALFVPLLVPGLREHKLFASGSGPGGPLTTLPDPLVQMNQELHEHTPQRVLSYTTTDRAPQYLQVYVLNKLTADTWNLGRTVGRDVRDGTLPAAPGLATGTKTSTEHTTISLAEGLTRGAQSISFLPLPYPARTVDVDGIWRANPGTLTMFSLQPLSGLSYSVTSQDVSPSVQQLATAGPVPSSVVGSYLNVPQAFLGLTRLAEQITAGQLSSYRQAVALQHWFADSGKFKYSLSAAEPNTPQALITFLTKVRRGYCQQFAFAMAVLARLLGIPSRVAVGYTEGRYAGHHRWVVSTADAHAWPELYFQDVGWLRFEPTPSGAAGQATATDPAYTLPPVLAAPTQPGSSTAPSAGLPQGKPSAGNSGAIAKLEHLAGAEGSGSSSASALPVGLLVAAAILVLMLLTPRSLRSLSRGRRWRAAAGDSQRAHAAWLELLDDLTDHHMAWSPSESPRALSRRVAGVLRLQPAEAEALTRISRAEERARYAREPSAPGTLQQDSAMVRKALTRNSGRAARWRARLLPASAIAPVRTGLQHALDVFSWMDMLSHTTRGWAQRLSGE